MKKSLYICILCLLTASGLSAQTTASGSWYGRADVDAKGIHNNYLTELVIKQKGNRVDGVFGYYFRDKYQSFFIHGRYNPKTREVTILNIPVIYYNSNSTVNSIDCNTNFRGVLINSKIKSSLKGAFYRDEKYKYMCPDLKVNYTLDRDDQRHDSVLGAAVTASSRVWKPQADDYVIDAAATKKEDSRVIAPAPGVMAPVHDSETTVTTKPASSASLPVTAVRTNAPVQPDSSKGKPDSLQTSPPPAGNGKTAGNAGAVDSVRTSAPAINRGVVDSLATPPPAINPEKKEKEDSKKIAESFSKRAPALNRVLEVESDSVRLSFYDNGEIDGDSISVFVNGRLVLMHQELVAKALTLYLHLDSTLATNEISMFAENLGKYPPNTALMVVTDGKNRYEVFMSSSLTENATIQIKRRKRPSQ